MNFESGELEGVIIQSLSFHRDERGWLVEFFRQDELSKEQIPQMAYVSQTMPNVTRGPHEHVDQTDLFAFLGPGDFRLHLWDARENSSTFQKKQVMLVGESNPTKVIVPPGVVHAYQNISDVPGIVFNAPNRLYAGVGKKEPVDEIRHEQNPHSPYVVDDES